MATAALTITGQNSESFGFRLVLPESSVEGVAYFNGAQTAICEKADGAIEFGFDAGAVSVTVDGAVSELGGADAGGIYAFIEAVTTTTTTTTTTAAPTEATTAPPPSSGKYDLDSIKSDAVQDALSSLMSAEEYQMLSSLLDASGGYGMIYGTGDSSKEVQGRRFNLDPQMNAVFYYVSGGEGAGREAVVICGDNGRLVYVGICDGSSYKYYTNDPERKSPSGAPRTISQYAKAKKMTLEG